MKSSLLAITLVLVLTGISVIAFAQDSQVNGIAHAIPKWISKTGYWVVESNVHAPRHNVVYFYNNENVMVYKETMDGIVLKLDKRRTKMNLKKIIDQTVIAYARKQRMPEDGMLVANLIK